jgi:hypothetical protein
MITLFTEVVGELCLTEHLQHGAINIDPPESYESSTNPDRFTAKEREAAST